MLTANQNPEQQARDNIDALLVQSGWLIQNKLTVNLSAAKGIAIREYPTDTGPADYILFVNKKAVGVIEAKREEEGVSLTMHEDVPRRSKTFQDVPRMSQECSRTFQDVPGVF